MDKINTFINSHQNESLLMKLASFTHSKDITKALTHLSMYEGLSLCDISKEMVQLWYVIWIRNGTIGITPNSPSTCPTAKSEKRDSTCSCWRAVLKNTHPLFAWFDFQYWFHLIWFLYRLYIMTHLTLNSKSSVSSREDSSQNKEATYSKFLSLDIWISQCLDASKYCHLDINSFTQGLQKGTCYH